MQVDFFNKSDAGRQTSGDIRRNYSIKRLAAVGRIAAVLSIALTILVQPLASSAVRSSQKQVLGATGAPAQSITFAVTGKSVAGDFLASFQRYGLERIGYPLSDERVENGQTVQYFERVRMERHPDLATKGYGVLFSRLGWDLSGGDKNAKVSPFASTSNKIYVSQTGHSLAEPFLSYWKSNGGVEFFGYPIAEPVNQGGLYVQWFERARMEYHPELAKANKTVQLSLLGSAVLGNSAPQVQTAVAQKQSVAQAQTQTIGVQLSPMESAMLRAVNDQRVAAGLRPVTLDASVTDLARARSNDMAQRNYFSHTTPDGTNFLGMMGDRKISYQYAGEILARNNYPNDQAQQTALNSYLASATHKAVIFDGRYTTVGVGYTFSSEDAMHYFTVIFVQQ